MWVNLHHMLKCPLQFLHEWLKWEGIPYFANTSFTNKLLSNFPCVNPNLLSWNLQLYPAARHYLSPHRTRPFFILYINYIYIYIYFIYKSKFLLYYLIYCKFQVYPQFPLSYSGHIHTDGYQEWANIYLSHTKNLTYVPSTATLFQTPLKS